MFRYVCNKCGSIYTLTEKLPKEEQWCDEIVEHTRKGVKYCGGTLVLQAVA
jgi:hypothetical protein